MSMDRDKILHALLEVSADDPDAQTLFAHDLRHDLSNANGKWNVDDVLRPIYEEASEMLGREFPYPGDEGN